ncbi:hypothetical protein K2173_028037 [Erythroxylum novogranatense]|uniref:Protein SERAC1 n=1 Tax=Erythroxylum novogranatense TaxID=1862640 RepID=A0AAV8U4D6_9ROSI|nr:hypothetical protein K2173_028037 [Erythroxylum novogranatense]
MLRLCLRPRRFYRLPLPRSFSSSSSSSKSPIEPPNNVRNSRNSPLQPPVLHHSPLVATAVPSTSHRSRTPLLVLSAALASAVVTSYAVVSIDRDSDHHCSPLRDAIDRTVSKSNESVKRIFHHFKQTGVAVSVLWQSLSSVLSSANHEVRVGFELKVAALLADIAAANAARRAALVGAGGGKVVDWLLETVAGGDGSGTQAEAARALSYLITDPNVSADVLGRPHAVPFLLRFIFSCQPKNKHSRRSSFDISDSLKGRSMLVDAIMDIVTSSCNNSERKYFKQLLPGNAAMRDIATAIEVIKEGGLHLDEPPENEDDDDGGQGVKGIGIKILEGTTAVGLSRTSALMDLEHSGAKSSVLLHKHDGSLRQESLSSTVVLPGLWDDLHCQHVAVPFAAWALANWAMTSEANRCHIQELDFDGQAVMTALIAPERSVKWHGSLVAQLLLEDRNLCLSDSVSDWSSSLLATIYQASKNEDIPLAQVALSPFLLSIERSSKSREVVMKKGLQLMRETAKLTTKYKQVHEALARALELLLDGGMHISLEESQRWSGILLPWVCGKVSSDNIQLSAAKILSCILKDHGPTSIPISQGWLAMLLNEVLSPSKVSSVKAGSQPSSDKAKTQIDQSKIVSATQAANQLASAVVNLAGKQLAATSDSVDTFALADFLSLEPFAGTSKNLKKDTMPKSNAADSALATLKALKTLTELCAEDSSCQGKVTEFGVLCLLRRFLLCDDYEKLAAIEAYDASIALEAPERVSSAPAESFHNDSSEPSSLHVPNTAHLRRHAARLLTILSVLPKVQNVIRADKIWCKWLDDCASGRIQGCTDHKLQSYARAVFLNVLCSPRSGKDSLNRNTIDVRMNKNSSCPRYSDMIFLINPGQLHWKHCETIDSERGRKDNLLSGVDSVDIEGLTTTSNVGNASTSARESQSDSESGTPQLDIVFIHGLRGGPYKTWRLADDKTSTKSGLVEKIDEEAGKQGTFWPAEWLSTDFPEARLFTIKYKSNLTQWSGASLPLQDVSAKILDKLVAAGVGNRPVVFVTHSMGGLVVKEMLYRAKVENIDNLVKNTVGVVFYSCPHFGSKLADMPWRMGLVLRPAPSIGELRSGSPRLVELNDFIRNLHRKRLLEVLSFCETKVTSLVEGYGGWAVRMEIVPIESAYPGYGELVVLESTDHVNSCKPVSRSDPSYTKTLDFLQILKARYS